MNIATWIAVGGLLGWLGFRFWSFNAERGAIAAIVIGAAGGLFGGHVIAPAFLSTAAIPANFNSPALLFAAALAAIFLVVGSLVHARWGV